MKGTTYTNPILPAAGVRRNQAADSGAGPPLGGLHDDWTPNPTRRGRAQSDHSPLSNALLRCKRPLIMATFNANTVKEEARLQELAHCVKKRGVEILGVQEHRIVHTAATTQSITAKWVGVHSSPLLRGRMAPRQPLVVWGSW